MLVVTQEVKAEMEMVHADSGGDLLSLLKIEPGHAGELEQYGPDYLEILRFVAEQRIMARGRRRKSRAKA